MKKTLLLFSILYGMTSYAQTVTTFAGKSNNDAFNNYESTSGVALNNTYFSLPEGICFTPNGKMYISERNKVRVVHNNLLYIRAGNLGSPGSSEGYKNALGTSSTFRVPSGMASDADGNIYVADRDNHCIRKIDKFVNLGNGQDVNTFAGAAPTAGLPGNGTSGSSNGTGTAASFYNPTGIAIDADGYLYVTDYNNFTVRKISPSGVVTTLAGSPGVEGTADGTTGSAARFGGPWGVAIYDDNHIVITDQWNCNIRKINKISGATTTLAGPTSPVSLHTDGTLTDARFKVPKGIAVVNGIIYVGDQNIVRAIDVPNNSVSTFAGDKSSFALTDGNGSNAAFTEISDVTTDGNGNLFVSENSGSIGSSVIRKITINDLAPTALFSAPQRDLLVDEKVILTDISTGDAVTSRTWTITPTNYDIYTGDLTTESLEISFKAVGFYKTSLQVTNDYGTDSKSVDAYFSVSTTGSVSKYTASKLISVYPNPSSDIVNLKLDPSLNTPHTKVRLYNMHGSQILDLSGVNQFSSKELPNGSYYITVVGSDLNLATQLIIAH